jgi:hypothetical protein
MQYPLGVAIKVWEFSNGIRLYFPPFIYPFYKQMYVVVKRGIFATL